MLITGIPVPSSILYTGVAPVGFGPAFERRKIGTSISHDGKVVPYGHYLFPYVACFNATGHPAMTIPLGLGEDGLPIGMQVVGSYWSEPVLIQFAKLVSEIVPAFIKPEGF